MARISVALFLLFVAPAAARAQAEQPAENEGSDATDQARSEFVEGTRLARRGEWREALAAFERSATLREHAVTRYNIAYCERALGHYVRSWVMFGRALERRDASGAPELPSDLADSARIYVPELEQKLARAKVRIPAGAELSIDGEPLESIGDGRMAAGLRGGAPPSSSASGSFELVADPGPHRFVLAKTRTKSVQRTLITGDNGTLVLELGTEPESHPTRVVPTAKLERREQRAAEIDYTWPLVAYGVGAAGIAVGSFFGVRALDDKAQLDKVCANHSCPRGNQDRIDAANRDALISTLGFGVGLGGIAAGTYLLVTQEPKANDRALAPWIGVGWLGARGRF